MKTAMVVLAAISLSATTLAANAECQCRGNGTTFELGQVACLNLPSGSRMARCEKVLNNTSWTFLGEGCPITQLDPSRISTPTPVPAGNADPAHSTTLQHTVPARELPRS